MIKKLWYMVGFTLIVLALIAAQCVVVQPTVDTSAGEAAEDSEEVEAEPAAEDQEPITLTFISWQVDEPVGD